jgi:NRPS condensation-like uncharacterized protein
MPRRFPAERMDRWMAWLLGDPPARNEMTVCMELDGEIAVPRLIRALQLVLDAVPLFRCRFVEHWWTPYWEEDPDRAAEQMVVVKPRSEPESHLQELWRESLEHGVKLIVWRGSTDALGVKFDHRFGDYRTLVELVNMIAEVYTRLCEDGDYRLPAYPPIERGLRQLTSGMSFRKRIALFRSFCGTTSACVSSGVWRLPARPLRDCHFTFALHTFHGRQLADLEDYGCERGATTFQVLLAAYFIAMTEALPDSDDLLPIIVPVDLRRFLPNPQPFRWCNFSGWELLFLQNAPLSSLDAIVEQVREQMFKHRAEGVGLASLPVILDMVPGGLPGSLAPFSLRRLIRRREIKQMSTNRRRKMLYGSHGGNLDSGRLRFGEIAVRHAIGCPGEVQLPGMFGFGTTSFADTLTMFCGSGPHDEMQAVQQRMLELLSPVFSESPVDMKAANLGLPN